MAKIRRHIEAMGMAQNSAIQLKRDEIYRQYSPLCSPAYVATTTKGGIVHIKLQQQQQLPTEVVEIFLCGLMYLIDLID